MGDTPKVSIIVPVYNVQDYLAHCLEAILAQTLRDIEVVCINDGSTDDSLEIAESFAARDPRLRVVTKSNEGYGATINRGFAEARADYVGIVESDDWPEPTMFEKLYALAVKHDCDLVKCDFFDTFDDHEAPRGNLNGLPYRKPFNAADYPQIMLITPSTWAALYRRSFLQRADIAHRETPGASFQDASFSVKCLYAAERIALLKEPLLHYRRDNPNASMQSIDKLYAAADEFVAAREYFRRDPQRYARFIPYTRLNEWHNYRWEYERIAPAGRVAFMQRVEAEMRAAAEAGELDFTLFSDEETARLKLLLATDAERFCRMLPHGFYGRCALHDDMPQAEADFLVSVVIPAYNDEDYVERAVASCRRQTHENIEVVCVDDCSRDGTLAKLRALAAEDARMKVVALPRNSGEHDARRAGVEQASGHLLLFLDADDELKPHACTCAVQEYLADAYDILQFSDEVASDGRISARKVREMAAWMRPDDAFLVGDDIVRRCFVEYACSHSAHSKAYHMPLAKRAFSELGSLRADSGVDALEYFALARNALVYRGVPDACCYVYHLGSGLSSREGMTYDEFARAIEGVRAIQGMHDYLEAQGCLQQWQDAYDAYRIGQTRFVVRTWHEDVREQDKPRALHEIVQRWNAAEVTDALCELGSGALDYLKGELGDQLQLTQEQVYACGFADGRQLARDEYENSSSYKLGRALTSVPRALRSALPGKRK